MKHENKLISLLHAFPSILPCSKWTKVKKKKLERNFEDFLVDTNTNRENILVKFRSAEILSITFFCIIIIDSPQNMFI